MNRRLLPFSFFTTPLPGIGNQLVEGPRDDRELRPCSPPAAPGQMMHANLGIGMPCPCEFVEDLGVDHRSPRLQLMRTEKFGVIELESTIHIAHVNPKNDTYQHLPAPGVEFAHPGILAIDTVSQHGIILLQQGKKSLQVADIELPIGVHKKEQIFAGSAEAAHQGRAISFVDRVMYDTHARIDIGNSIYKAPVRSLLPSSTTMTSKSCIHAA